jgi:hypothetical protein
VLVPTYYRSSDSGAPVLTGETGTLVALLDAVLVNGYGAKAAAGWTKAFAAASKGVYLQGASLYGANSAYLRVDDAGPGAATFQEARIRAYKTMSDIDTGTGPTPTVAQAANGLFVRKSAAASATAREWWCYADGRTFTLGIRSGDNVAWWYVMHFGDIASEVVSDPWPQTIIGRATENSAVAATEFADQTNTTITTPLTGHYLMETYTGGAASWNNGSVLLGALNYTNGPNGAAMVTNTLIYEPTTHYRGKLRGIWCWGHTIANLTDDSDLPTAVGAIAGKTFRGFKSGPNGGCYVMETSAWETSL